MNCLLLPYCKSRGLDAWALAAWFDEDPPEGGGKRIFSMAIDLHPESFLLIPVGFAVWFMLWALWHWWKEEKR